MKFWTLVASFQPREAISVENAVGYCCGADTFEEKLGRSGQHVGAMEM
jgi:hypothetical protein